jgi:hypothetical protein
VSTAAIGVNLKASPSFSEQHADKHEPKHTLTPKKKEIDSNLKSHRHCPKIRNNDFFMELKGCNKSKSTNNITLYHQNVHSLTNKIDELNIFMESNYTGPQLICFTEHHLKESEITKLSLEVYTLVSGFCRKEFLGGGVCILINKILKYQPIDLSHFCYELTLEICAVKLYFESLKLIIFCIYRAPTGNLEQFFALMEKILNYFLQPKVTFLICSDLNVNLLTKSNDALRLLTITTH